MLRKLLLVALTVVVFALVPGLGATLTVGMTPSPMAGVYLYTAAQATNSAMTGAIAALARAGPNFTFTQTTVDPVTFNAGSLTLATNLCELASGQGQLVNTAQSTRTALDQWAASTFNFNGSKLQGTNTNSNSSRSTTVSSWSYTDLMRHTAILANGAMAGQVAGPIAASDQRFTFTISQFGESSG